MDNFYLKRFLILSVILAALSPKVNALSHFSILYLIHGNLSSPLALLLLEIDMCVRCVFCRKLNYGQLLFEAFFNFIGNFGSIEPYSDCTIPFQYIIFETSPSFKLPAPLLEEIKHVSPYEFTVGN